MNNDISTRQATVSDDINGFLAQKIQALPDHAIRLKSAMQHALLAGGKRIRPLLHNITATTLGVNEQDTVPIGAAIECIHAYSLVHDDLPAMDDDDTRRGQPTCHIAFDEATAILAGDALQTLAFEILTTAEIKGLHADKRLQIVRSIAEASGYLGMCGGQAIDLAATNTTIDIERLTQLHQLKTGALLTGCVKSAISMADSVSPKDQSALLQYATNIGLAFQVQDDILDVTASSETLGKPSGSDVQANKSTFPSLLGLTNAQQKLQKYHQQALQALTGLPYNTELLRQFADLMMQRKY